MKEGREKKVVKHQQMHVLVYGDTGAEKSTLAASFPKPMIVMLFDPPDKGGPYVRWMEKYCSRIKKVTSKETGLPVVIGLGADGKMLVRLERFNDSNARKPKVFKIFQGRMSNLREDMERWGVSPDGTVVCDSVTYMNWAAFHQQKYVIQPDTKEPRQWYAETTNRLTEVLAINLANLDCNVVVTAHIDEREDEVHGRMIYNPACPGKLSKRLPGGFGELYRAYRGKDGAVLQTEGDEEFNAATQVGAPNGCRPRYRELWKGRE